jgi:hypothetical protein
MRKIQVIITKSWALINMQYEDASVNGCKKSLILIFLCMHTNIQISMQLLCKICASLAEFLQVLWQFFCEFTRMLHVVYFMAVV